MTQFASSVAVTPAVRHPNAGATSTGKSPVFFLPATALQHPSLAKPSRQPVPPAPNTTGAMNTGGGPFKPGDAGHPVKGA